MAIIKKANNINIQVADTYTSLSKISYEEAEETIIEATKGNVTLISQKRVILQGFGRENEKDEDNGEGKITEMAWVYGENNSQLSDSSKFFVDMNLMVKTEGYEEGESIEVTIKSEDGEPIAEGLGELNLSGKVDKDGIVIFKEPLKDYTVKLMEEDNEIENT